LRGFLKLENCRHVGPACQRLCCHAACPDWPSKAVSLVSVRAAKRRPRQHAVPSRPVRSHVGSPVRARCAAASVSGAAHSIEAERASPCWSLAPLPCCRRPARASAPPLPSTGKRAATAPPSSDELVSYRRLAASASSSHRVEPRCSTKSTASGHASCAAAAEVPSCSKPPWLLLPSRSGCHRWAGSHHRRRGPELPHGAATERRRHRAVTAETWFPTSVGSDAVAST
jgi:hypothetical protein